MFQNLLQKVVNLTPLWTEDYLRSPYHRFRERLDVAGDKIWVDDRAPQLCNIGELPVEILKRIFYLCLTPSRDRHHLGKWVEQIAKLRGTCVIWASVSLQILRRRLHEENVTDLPHPYILTIGRIYDFYPVEPVIGNPPPSSYEDWQHFLRALRPADFSHLTLVGLPWPKLKFNSKIMEHDHLVFEDIVHALGTCRLKSLQVIGLQSLSQTSMPRRFWPIPPIGTLALTQCAYSDEEFRVFERLTSLESLSLDHFVSLSTSALRSFLRHMQFQLIFLELLFHKPRSTSWDDYSSMTFQLPAMSFVPMPKIGRSPRAKTKIE
ncbi:hypothetical protein BT69DRAFT_516811 [Atractiella rhizophila]|nr:hypothetical protein BT69DRAFT_516811 [Atractiella rhizophila]